MADDATRNSSKPGNASASKRRRSPALNRESSRHTKNANAIKVSHESAGPLYLQIKNAVIAKIESGEWPPHYPFPTYKELSKEMGVSIVTIQQSIGVLVKEGRLYNKRGVGVFVAPPESQPYGRIIALLLPDVRHPFFSSLAHFIQTYASKSQYSTFFLSLCDSHEDSIKAARLLSPSMVAGVIATHSLTEHLPGCLEDIIEEDKIVVYIGGYTDQSDSVDIDNRLGIELAINHLIELGHKRIAFVAGHFLGSGGRERIEAFKSLLAEKRLPFEPPQLQLSVYEDDLAGQTAAHMLLSLRDVPTAIICVNDVVARGALKVLRERGVKCPEEMSIVGFDDLDFARYLEPPLTTIRQPIQKMGEGAVDLLLERINSGARRNPPYKNIQLTPELIIRSSTAAPNNS